MSIPTKDEYVPDNTATPERFTLVCERRDDGGLRITCPDVPGFMLSGADVRAVLRDVAPAMHAIVMHNAQSARKANGV